MLFSFLTNLLKNQDQRRFSFLTNHNKNLDQRLFSFLTNPFKDPAQRLEIQKERQKLGDTLDR